MDNSSSNETLHTSKELESLTEEIAAIQNPSEKLKKTIDLMELSIAQKGQPDFKIFWNSRESCLELFKEDIPPAVRSGCWQKYRELTQQARSLKEHFEEESSFALEQIEKAVAAIEDELDALPQLIDEAEISDFPKLFPPFESNQELYLLLQKELNFLNAYASRINALRKEVISTKMKMRRKNRFFEKLSEIGNRVFPRRKVIIESISNHFCNDIESYIKKRSFQFSKSGSPHVFREEIKALQAAAKILSLNGKAFSETRQKLSECWDKLKELDKLRRTELDQKKEIFVKNANEIRKKIALYVEEFSSGGFSTSDAKEKINAIVKEMKDVELSREEVKQLRHEIAEAKKPLIERQKEEERKRREAQLEKEEKRQKEIDQIEKTVGELLEKNEGMNAAEIFSALDSLKAQIDQISFSESERDQLLRSLVPLEDAAYQKQDDEVQLPEEPGALKEVLQNRLHNKIEHRNAIKDQLEEYRKVCGSSGMNFEQSLFYNQQLNIEKDRLEKVARDIYSIEQRLSEI